MASRFKQWKRRFCNTARRPLGLTSALLATRGRMPDGEDCYDPPTNLPKGYPLQVDPRSDMSRAEFLAKACSLANDEARDRLGPTSMIVSWFRRPKLVTEVVGDEIIVMMPGSSFKVSYMKAGAGQLVASWRSRGSLQMTRRVSSGGSISAWLQCFPPLKERSPSGVVRFVPDRERPDTHTPREC